MACDNVAASASRLSFLKSVFLQEFHYVRLQRRWPIVFLPLHFRKNTPAIVIINMIFKRTANAVLITLCWGTQKVRNKTELRLYSHISASCKYELLQGEAEAQGGPQKGRRSEHRVLLAPNPPVILKHPHIFMIISKKTKVVLQSSTF